MDRAKQKLVLMALEPEWEARFEASSYGFRPGRSCQDAIEKIFLSLRSKGNNSPLFKYVLDADLKGCFNNISHEYLLGALGCSPRIANQIRAWLKAGIFEGSSLDESEYQSIPENPLGTPQGGIISPFLSNVALHGMEDFLKSWITTQTWPVTARHQLYTVNKKKSLTFVRYADDFVVIHPDRDILVGAKEALTRWLASTSQLSFNEEKTRVIRTDQGFNFLGCSFITLHTGNRSRIKIYPSAKNQEKFIKTIGDFCRKHRSLSAYELVAALRPRIIGWANSFRYSECKLVFSKLDRLIFNILRSWVFRRDRRNGRMIVKEKYFPSGKKFTFDGRTYSNNWILCGKKRISKDEVSENFLPRIYRIKASL